MINRDKLDYYFARTVEHIHRVQRNALRLVTHYRDRLALNDEDCRELMHAVMRHDCSKFSPQQFAGYVELTEYFRQRKARGNASYEYPPGVRELSDAAWQDHYQVENHHPEQLARDLGKWSHLQAIECACDLQAMAQEYGEGTCRAYWRDVWLPKQRDKFYDDYNYQQVYSLMDKVIRCFEADAKEESSGSSAGGRLGNEHAQALGRGD